MGESRAPSDPTPELKLAFENLSEYGLQETLDLWKHIFGSVPTVVQDELKKQFEEFWREQCTKFANLRDEYVCKIDEVGKKAIKLEKDLGLEPLVHRVPNDLPLVKIEEQLSTLLEEYEELKKKRVDEYTILRNENEKLLSVLDLKKYDFSTSQSNNEDYIPTTDEMNRLKENNEELKKKQEELIYEFEDAKNMLHQLLEDCAMSPFSKEEKFVYGKGELEVTKINLTQMRQLIEKYSKIKDDLMAEAEYRRDLIKKLSQKMGYDQDEVAAFLSQNSGYSQPTLNKLHEKVQILKEERKTNLKELIANSREVLTEWWNKCWYSQSQRDEFKYFKTEQIKEEVLELHECEIEEMEMFYNQNKKIFALAAKHEELWERLLHLEQLSNDKDRLFKNRGGCLLQEERERKVIQKKLPEIKSQLIAVLDEYKERTGKDFLQYGEPLKQKIEMKEQMREMSKNQERMQRKLANVENVIAESHLGAKPGTKRKAVMTPNAQKHYKTMKYDAISPSSSKSTLSSKSTASSCVSTLVQKEKERKPVISKSQSTEVLPSLCLRTPRTRKPIASTPKDGPY